MLESLEILGDFEAFFIEKTRKSRDITSIALNRFIPEIGGKKWLNRTAIEKGLSHITKMEQFRSLKQHNHGR